MIVTLLMKKAKQDKTMTVVQPDTKIPGKRKKAEVVKVTEGALERESKNGAKIGIFRHIRRRFIPLAY